MSEEITHLTAISSDSVVYVDAMTVMKGEVIISAEDCKCGNDHPTEVVPVIVIVFRDMNGKEYNMAFPVESPLTEAFTSQDISYRVRSLVGD